MRVDNSIRSMVEGPGLIRSGRETVVFQKIKQKDLGSLAVARIRRDVEYGE